MKRTLGPRSGGVGLAGTLLLILFAIGALPLASASAAGVASFPGPPPPVQITRNLSLQQAARAGAVKLSAKGGYEGDDVELELDGKKVNAPITVTIREQFAWTEGHSEGEQKTLRDNLPRLQQETEHEFDKRNYKTAKGQPINFNFEFKFLAPGEAADPSYNQVTILSPTKDLPEPNPGLRSKVTHRGVPNTGEVGTGVFPITELDAETLAHESMHLMGLGDRYTDVYSYEGHEIALPKKGMSPKELSDFLKTQKPPVPPPPAGEVESKDTPGTGPCDLMGSGANESCRRLSKRDLKFVEAQAGIQVEAKPGELLLNKRPADQNLAVGYTTRVIAPAGGTTVAPGVSAYCVDHEKAIPSLSGFDVGPQLSALPGFSGVERLLVLNAEVQPSLAQPTEGMQAALWNVTNGSPIDNVFNEPATVAAARTLLARAGVAETSNAGGLLHIEDPNAAVVATGAIEASGAIMPPLESEPATPPPAITVSTAELIPSRVGATHTVRSSLVLDVGGEVATVALKLQHRLGHHWRSLKSLPSHKVRSEETVIPLKLGSLKAGRYRVQVTFSGPSGEPAVSTAPLTMSAGA